jgi:hypothetical protein
LTEGGPLRGGFRNALSIRQNRRALRIASAVWYLAAFAGLFRELFPATGMAAQAKNRYLAEIQQLYIAMVPLYN